MEEFNVVVVAVIEVLECAFGSGEVFERPPIYMEGSTQKFNFQRLFLEGALDRTYLCVSHLIIGLKNKIYMSESR